MTDVPSKSGPIKAVILDWAGTTVDFGSRAPAQVFREIFAREGIDITECQVRGPMGMSKRAHIAAILDIPEVAAVWRNVKGRSSTEADIDSLYKRFLPLQLDVLHAHANLIPGADLAFAWLQKRGIKCGSSTGYTKALMEVVLPVARAAGYAPEVTICSDDVPEGRPTPWMLFEAAKQLNVYPMHSIVAVDDTPVGIQAGRNAGCWTVAIAATGNEMGLSLEQLQQLSPEDRSKRIDAIREHLLRAGSHIVIESIAELPAAVEELENWIRSGRRP